MEISKNGIRILKPVEYEQLRNSIPRKEDRIKLDALLATGMRYEEMKLFMVNPEWKEGKFIHLKRLTNKGFSKRRDRYIRLSRWGTKAVDEFLKISKLPSWVTWDENLIRWSKKAQIDGTYPSVKTTRKTIESWLVFSYEQKAMMIANSQGHDTTTQLQDYLGLPFNDKDKSGMIKYVDGWI